MKNLILLLTAILGSSYSLAKEVPEMKMDEPDIVIIENEIERRSYINQNQVHPAAKQERSRGVIQPTQNRAVIQLEE